MWRGTSDISSTMIDKNHASRIHSDMLIVSSNRSSVTYVCRIRSPMYPNNAAKNLKMSFDVITSHTTPNREYGELSVW